MMRVLVVEDNESVCTALKLLLQLNEIDATFVHGPEEALRVVETQPFGLVLQDMNFTKNATSGEEGIALFRQLKKRDPLLPIMLITAWSSLETAIMLVKEGAHDYLNKPWDDEKLIGEIKSVLSLSAYRSQPRRENTRVDECGMVYGDPKSKAIIDTAVQIAQSDVPVLITGPNGAGKEVLALVVQANSSRKEKPFIKVNTGALPDELLEAELFGAEAGAYTGARQRRIGRFEEANGGTLFLDEIGNLGMAGQMKLLRVLQSGEFSRLGHNRTLTSDVRVISATNADLHRAIKERRFREDLYFRLNVVELHVPGLWKRPGDILPLANHFLKTLPEAVGKHLTADAERVLLNHDWPGNVRELRNRIQRAALVSRRPFLTPRDLDLGEGRRSWSGAEPDRLDTEKEQIQQALKQTAGNVSQAAEQLGMSRQALYRRMRRHGIVWGRRPLE